MNNCKLQYLFLKLLFLVLIFSCSKGQQSTEEDESSEKAIDTLALEDTEPVNLDQLADTAFIKMQNISQNFIYDMRYATSNNFLKETVYDCENCWLRVKVAQALIKANNALMDKGYQIKFFDCFRPRAVQYKMWEILPDGRYVANPERGSIHNRGAAVDISLVDLETKKPLKMGTDFDYFGEEAHHSFTDLDPEILENRQLLKNVMEKFGFSPIRTEWWHYNFAGTNYSISDQILCDE